MNLEKIIVRSKNNERDAQRQLFEVTCDFLKSIAMRYTYDHMAAEDVLQNAYIRIFQNIGKFQYVNDAMTFSWMRRIVATESLRYIKKKDKWDSAIENGAMEYSNFQLSHASDDLLVILAQLPAKQRIVFNMHSLEGYNHKEIADFLGIEESSSRSLLTRARKKLKLLLTKSHAYAQL